MTHILVVDDNQQNLYYLRALLTANGITVDLARHGVEALQKARQQPPDLVVSDLLMPVMDGYTLLRHWKTDDQLKNVPFVVYTATYRDDKDQQLAFDLGADDFILKPEEPDQFLRKIRAAQNRPPAETSLLRGTTDESELLRNYSETLIRKLEEKSLKLEEKTARLEETNFALQRELVERNQVEMTLRLSESRLDLERERLLDAQRLAKMGSWETDILTGMVQWSDETHRIFETDPRSFTPTHQGFLALVHPEDRENVDRAFQESLNEIGSYALEHRLLLPNGVIKFVDERWRVFRDFAGNPVRALGTCHDVTDRTIAEAELRKTTESLTLSSSLLRIAGRLARVGGWSLRIADLSLTWSDEICDIHEVPPGYRPNLDEAYDFYPVEYRSQVRTRVEALVREGVPYEFESPLITAKGRRLWVRSIGEAVRDTNGQICQVQGGFQDITEQHLAAETIRESEERFRLLAKATNDAVRDWYIGTNQVWWNDGIETLFGFSRDELGNSLDSWSLRIHPEDRDRIVGQLQGTIESCEEVWTGTYRFARKDGSYAHVWDRVIVIRDQNGVAIRMLGGMSDISEQRKAESALKASLVELSHRNRELQDFAFVASHDLQEPLRKIRTFSELLATRYRDSLDGQAADYLDRMNHAATRMQTLIKDLLEYSRTAQGAQPSGQTDLARVCREVLSDLEPRILASGAKIVEEGLPTITADATQMRQLFQNLLSNALKFLDARRKPEISVVAQSVSLDGAPACRLIVADNGIGFEEKFAEGIFNPFKRLHARTEFEGTGIGLAIVRRIVERHRGTIEAFSTPGVGTKFVVTLPVDEKHPA